MTDTRPEDIADDIRARIVTNYPNLNIGRIPEKTFQEFKLLAKQEFCNDYGMCLKHLLDFYQGLIPSGWEHLELEIVAIKQKLEEIEGKLTETTTESKHDKVRKMLNGRKIEKIEQEAK